ncbi:MAG: 3-phosphoshikimate 1-carboxyvinyltransferase [Phycisphaerae bacterium]|nr:3-phosphoshikimate 1-carboxyvinyltransferase [Phycisphaerae bacterium]
MVPAMRSIELHPPGGPLDAVVRLPGSKSLTNRALMVAALADGPSHLAGVLRADDTRHMIEALRMLGIGVTVDEHACAADVQGCAGHLPNVEADLFCGNSGTTIRFCTALCAVGHGGFRLDGTPRMRERPIGQLVEVLQSLGTPVEYLEHEGYPPLVVHGRGMAGGHVAFDSPPSSQLISALLMSAPRARSDVLIEVTGQVVSVPYIRMTLAVLEAFGVSVVDEIGGDGARFIVPAPQPYRGRPYDIEPDASNASYFLAAPAIAGGRVTVEGLGSRSVQGDARFVDVLEQMGCRVDREPDRLTVCSPPAGTRLRGISIDLNDMPDMVQTLAVVALFADGPTHVHNVENLRVKETDRLAALAHELRALGASVEERPDGLSIQPPQAVRPASVNTYDDHRMAMSFALAGLRAQGIVINDPECTAKTFPDFFERWAALCRSTGRCG